MSNRDNLLTLARGIKLDREYKNVLNPDTDWIYNIIHEKEHLILETTDFSYIRHSGIIKINQPINIVQQANYIAFLNSLEEWTYFGWIDRLEYVSDNCTAIYWTMDIWSTYTLPAWRDSTGLWRLQDCYVVREHVNSDDIGDNLQPENVNLGDYRLISNAVYNLEGRTSEKTYGAVFITSADQDGNVNPASFGAFRGNVYTGLDYTRIYTTARDASAFNSFIDNYKNHPDDIVAILMCPYWILTTCSESNGFIATDTLSLTLTKAGNYKNNKCYTYPYTKVQLDNNNGDIIDLAFENFVNTGNIARIKITGIYAPAPEAVAVPVGYNNNNYGFDLMVKLNNFPACSWASDYFENWWALSKAGIDYSNRRAQQDYTLATGMNVVNTSLGIGTSIVQAATGNANYTAANNSAILSSIDAKNPNLAAAQRANTLQANRANYIGSLAQGALNVAGTAASGYFNQKQNQYNLQDALFANSNAINQATLQANPVHGSTSAGTIDAALDYKYCFSLRQYQQRPDLMKTIDDYFSMFGYSINQIKLPLVASRKHFNYVKVVGDCGVVNDLTNYKLSIPASSMEFINDLFRRGLTIWKKHDEIGNYIYMSDNSIV